MRSFPPVNPVCLRWTFPVWQVEPELDPTKLAEGRRRKAADTGEPKTQWDEASFVETFVAARPKTIAAIAVEALAAGLSERRTKLFLDAAEGKGLVHRRQDPKDRRKAWYSTEPIPENER